MFYNSQKNIWVFVLFCLFLTSCQQERKKPLLSTYQGVEMTVPYRVVLDTKGEGAEKIIEDVFVEIDTVCNQWNPLSEISYINELDKEKTHTLSHHLQNLFSVVDQVYSISDGLYDPTVEPLVQLWKGAFSKKTLPDSSAIAKVQKQIGWQLLVREGNLLTKRENVQCNFDGVAKGYLVDQLVEELEKGGYQSIYVEWGGEIRVKGEHPEGRPWKVMVTGIGGGVHSRLETIDLVDKAIASSGDYYQQWKIQDTVYTHIVDPRTGQAQKVQQGNIGSATVTASSCAVADALATTLLLFSDLEKAQEWATIVQKEYPDVQIWFMQRK